MTEEDSELKILHRFIFFVERLTTEVLFCSTRALIFPPSRHPINAHCSCDPPTTDTGQSSQRQSRFHLALTAVNVSDQAGDSHKFRRNMRPTRLQTFGEGVQRRANQC